MVKLNLKPSPTILRQFAAGLVVLTLGWGGLNHQVWRDDGRVAAGLACALLVSVVGLIAPRAIKYVYLAVSIVTFPIGFVTSYVILGVIFFLLLSPLAIVLRLRGRDVLGLRKRGAPSYWLARKGSHEPEYYLRQ